MSLFGVRPVGAVSGVENYQGSFRYDRVTGRWLEIVHTADPGVSVGTQLSPDGQWAVAYRSDTGSRWVQQLDVRPTSPFDTRWDVFTAALTG